MTSLDMAILLREVGLTAQLHCIIIDIININIIISAIITLCLLYSCPVDNTESTFGMTPLDMAILMGDVESTAQLLAAGADPEHLLKLFALTDLYDVTVIHPDKRKTRELLDDDDKVCY